MSPTVATAMFWIAATCCIVAQIALIVSAIRSPMSGSADSADVAMPRRSGEIAWTILPAIGLVLLLLFTWKAVHPAVAPPDEHSGHQKIGV